uniref:Uncharacterized protein LOC101502893 n=1 Tax=Cicer arietinum TaxID=3827 RepID=A0A1S2YHQ2_CICAR|nr:uncharacterized protein LOC101502893 [Cicer arietinum]
MFSSNPLFSCIITFCTLVFLYLPHLFSKIVLSPVLILTAILLLTILRVGAIQRSQHEQKENPQKYREDKQKQSSTCSIESKETQSLAKVQQWNNSCDPSEIEVNSEMGFESSSCFVEWNVRAPLDVIYEEYEGEEKGNDPKEKEENQNMGISNYPSLSRYYPESDSDSSSDDWDSPEDMCFRWDEEDREGLIEIALDGSSKVVKREMEFQYEEENLIEIDISPTRYKELSGNHEALSGEISCN